MKKIAVWVLVIMFLFSFTVFSDHFVNKELLKEDYYELIVTVSHLFDDHTYGENYFYNRSFSREAEIAELLNNKVTPSGFELVVDTLFEEYEDHYVYKPRYQEYISDTRNFTHKEKEISYYDIVRNTILNPALRLISFEELEVAKEKNRITLEGHDIKVNFYEEEAYMQEHHQYARFGFPPKDHISFAITFVYDNGKYLLDDFVIRTNGM